MNNLEKFLLDILFLFPRITGNGDPLSIAGVRGFFSPVRDAYANRAGLVSGDDIDTKIRLVQAFFSEIDKGLTWVVSQDEIATGLPAQLMRHGFHPARFPSAAGMSLSSPYPEHRPDSDIRIEEMDLAMIGDHIELIAAVYDYPSPALARHINSVSTDTQTRSRYYLAYIGNSHEPIGFGRSVYLYDHHLVLLQGAGVLAKYRGRGVYRQLIHRRLADAAADGINTITTLAARNSSYAICKRFGFIERCAIELYEWSP